MEINLSYNENGAVVGYNITASTKKEQEILLQVRNLNFYNSDNPILYDGMGASEKHPDLVEQVNFITKDQMAIRDNLIAKRDSVKVQTAQAVSDLADMGLVQTGDDTFTLSDPRLKDVEIQVVKRKRKYTKRKVHTADKQVA